MLDVANSQEEISTDDNEAAEENKLNTAKLQYEFFEEKHDNEYSKVNIKTLKNDFEEQK